MGGLACLYKFNRYEAEQKVREDTLANSRALSDTQKRSLYTQYCFGEKVEDLAQAYGISAATAYRYIKEERSRVDEREGVEVAARSKIVAGDKTNGRLTSTTDQHRFEGTCVIGGKKHSKTFVTVNAKKATEMWEKWCQDLRDEQEFMDRIERREPEPDSPEREQGTKAASEASGDPVEEGVPVEPAPTPVIEVRPWRDVAQERQQRIEELEARVAELEDKERVIGVIDGVVSDTEGETPKLGHWFNDNGSFRVFWMNKPVYVLWAKTDNPRLYGVYRTMEDALKEVDKLNEVAAFLGNASAFEVEEVAWR